MNVTGREKLVPQINCVRAGTVLRWREGEDVTIRVHNRFDVPTSIHWHGIILPARLDGVPATGLPASRPQELHVPVPGPAKWHLLVITDITDSQEQAACTHRRHRPATEPRPIAISRSVGMLSDWTDEEPARVYAKLKSRAVTTIQPTAR